MERGIRGSARGTHDNTAAAGTPRAVYRRGSLVAQLVASGGRFGLVVHLHDALAASEEQGALALEDRIGADDALPYVRARRYLIHYVEQDLFDQRAQAARPRLVAQRPLGRRLQRVLGEDEFNLVE